MSSLFVVPYDLIELPRDCGCDIADDDDDDGVC
jgi:hypothetical protein